MLNEFRQDLVSGEWILFATERGKRSGSDLGARKETLKQSKKDCPFEDPEGSGNEVLVTYDGSGDIQDGSESGYGGDWFAKVMKNKFPAVVEGASALKKEVGPFSVTDAKGFHEVIVYRDHERPLPEFSPSEISRVFGIYQNRCQIAIERGSAGYVLIFHNHGPKAGASISHPHSQIISIPILPPDVKRSLFGSERFYKNHQKRVYDLMIDWELKEKKRVVHESDNFIVFCPFVSKTPYEIRIFCKESHAHFEQMPLDLLPELGEIMSLSLKKMDAALDNPDFNFFIHTAPTDPKYPNIHEFYSWHVEILPKIKVDGAFELASGISVNVIDPDNAAELLRNAKI